MKRDISLRQQMFAKAYLETGSVQEAARRAGYSARYNPLRRAEFQQYLDQLMEEMGVGDEEVIRKLAEGLSAVAVRIDKNGEEHVVPDFHARAKFLDMALRLRQMYPPRRPADWAIEGSATVVRGTPALAAPEPEEGEDGVRTDGSPEDPVGADRADAS